MKTKTTVPRGTRWIPLLLLALGLGSATAASAANARLRGTVTDIDGEPVPGAQVTLVSESGGTRLTETTDRKGRFRLLIVDPTHPPYFLELEKEGYQPLREEVALQANEAVTFDAVLAPTEAPPPEAEEGPAAGDPEAVALYNEAAALYNEGSIAEAAARFEEAVALDPSLAPAHRILASLYASQGRHEQALQAAERLLELEPGDPEASLVRYDALAGLGRTAEAREALDRLMERGDPAEVSKRLYNVAAQLQKEGDEEEALALFRRAAELDPQLAPAWSAIAGIELTKKRPEQAAEAAGHLLALRPGDTEALTIQYEAYKMMGDAARAEELLARMESVSDDPGVLYRRGVAAFNANNFEQAVPLLRQAVAADPELAGAHYTLGLALINQGDNQGALEHFRRFLELAPDHSDAETARQMVEYLEGQ